MFIVCAKRDYRIIYTYGDGWVVLMGVDARKDVYKGDKLVAEKTEVDIRSLPDVAAVLTIKPSYSEYNTPAPTITQTPLPIQLTAELLKRLRIPEEYWDTLIACQTLEDLTGVNLPTGSLSGCCLCKDLQKQVTK
ncbi:hypothetical protein NIES4071_07340 [Calothrix sp. NIES-4071]|nr:hypothetical protein NIES4071_07340 [Calothrix sp. NIES-4071]BAZ55076.1 hypothetical protein NIES4105_07300 [Calothrix sp. NIES-4105]